LLRRHPIKPIQGSFERRLDSNHRYAVKRIGPKSNMRLRVIPSLCACAEIRRCLLATLKLHQRSSHEMKRIAPSRASSAIFAALLLSIRGLHATDAPEVEADTDEADKLAKQLANPIS